MPHYSQLFLTFNLTHYSPTITKRHWNIPGIDCVCNGIQIACGIVASNIRQWSKCISNQIPMYTIVETELRFGGGVVSQERGDVAVGRYCLDGVGERVNNRSNK
jgi:hypothetical protein